MILRWSPFKLVSVSAVLYPRWPPLLKIEISSNGQNCSILSQKVPKFRVVEIGSVVSEEKTFYKFHPPLFSILSLAPSWLEVGFTGHNFGRAIQGPFHQNLWILRRRFLCEFPIGFYDQDGRHSRT
jgi:hypothetical protein